MLRKLMGALLLGMLVSAAVAAEAEDKAATQP